MENSAKFLGSLITHKCGTEKEILLNKIKHEIRFQYLKKRGLTRAASTVFRTAATTSCAAMWANWAWGSGVISPLSLSLALTCLGSWGITFLSDYKNKNIKIKIPDPKINSMLSKTELESACRETVNDLMEELGDER